MTIYDRIRELRLSLGWSQDELAKKMGYKDRSMITKIESGIVDISQKKIARFAEVLQTTTSYLMGWNDPDESVSGEESRLVSIYRSLSRSGKDYLLQQASIAAALYGEKDSASSSDAV